jgi:hypothetical protein
VEDAKHAILEVTEKKLKMSGWHVWADCSTGTKEHIIKL